MLSATYFVSTLVEIYLWWSFPSGGVILHTASALHSGGGFSLTTVAVLTLSAVVERCVWHRPVHTATQLNRLSSTDLLATGPGFDPR